jgi:hypothetical protein
MYVNSHLHRLQHVTVLLAAGILLMACSLPLSLPESGIPESGIETPTPTPTQWLVPDRPEEPGPTPFDKCPKTSIQATLTFDHNIEWGLEGTGQFGVAVKGTYLVNIVESEVANERDTMTGVYNLGTGPFLVTVSAKGFKDCTDGQGETSMQAFVTGTCIGDTLTLNIEEVYEAASVSILCNKDDKVDIPVPLSAMMAPITWSTPIAQLSAGGAEKQVPFMGMGGSGAMTYKLTIP